MRTPLALGAAALLALGLTAGPAAATGGKEKSPWEGPDDSRMGAVWEGGSADIDGVTYRWPETTYSWTGKVCPDMDEPKTGTDDDPETVTLTAPEDKLISAYCVKSGSGELGPKIVILDEPTDALTIAYVEPGTNKAKGISHYAVAYVEADAPTDAPDETPKPTPSTPDGATPPAEASPSPSAEPSEEPVAEEPDETTVEPGSDESPDPRPQEVVPVEPGADESVEPRASEVSVEVEADAADMETVRAQTDPELPQTGPGRAIGITLGALALVGAGVGAVLFARSRRAGA